MFTNDKKTLNKALYVCLTVSSMLVTTNGYGMELPDDYRNTPSGKRPAINELENQQAKRQKNTQGLAILINPKRFLPKKPYIPEWIDKKPEGSMQMVKTYVFEGFSRFPGEIFSTEEREINKQFKEAKKIVSQVSYALEDTYENLSKKVERNIIIPINNFIDDEDDCKCVIF